MKQDIRLSGKQLVISPMSLEEVRDLCENTEDAELQAAYRKMLTNADNNPKDYLWYFPWKMRLHGHKTIIGNLNFMGPPRFGAVALCYTITEKYEKHGYTTEAIKLMSGWALKQHGVYGIFSDVVPDNRASRKVLESNAYIPYKDDAEHRFVKLRNRSGLPAVFVCAGAVIGAGVGIITDTALLWSVFGLLAGTVSAMLFGIIEDGKCNRALAGKYNRTEEESPAAPLS